MLIHICESIKESTYTHIHFTTFRPIHAFIKMNSDKVKFIKMSEKKEECGDGGVNGAWIAAPWKEA